MFFADQILDIIEKVGCLFLVMKHDEVTGSNRFMNGRQHDGIEAAGKAFYAQGITSGRTDPLSQTLD